MVSSSSLALFGLLIVTTIHASPVHQRRSAGIVPITRRHNDLTARFTIDALKGEIDRANARYPHPSRRSLAGHAKRNVEVEALPPFDINERRSKEYRRQSIGPLTLNNEGNNLYWADISVGTPPQNIPIAFDTGSSDMVFPTAECLENCIGPLFNSTLSSTYNATTTLVFVRYGDGSGANGVLASDTVSVAGLSVDGQGFGALRSETKGFSTGPNSGLMGLAFTALSSTGTTPFVFNLAAQGKLVSNIFSMFLSRTDDKNATSELCLGCLDSTKYTENITYYPLDATATGGIQKYWTLASSGFAVNSTVVTEPIITIMDSGTALVFLPPAHATAFYAKVPGAVDVSIKTGITGLYAIPCKPKKALPRVGILFGGTSYTIGIQDFNLGPVNGLEDGQCAAAVIGRDIGGGMAVVGDAFLRGFYTVYDMGNNQVGLAPAV